MEPPLRGRLCFYVRGVITSIHTAGIREWYTVTVLGAFRRGPIRRTVLPGGAGIL